MSQKLRFAVGAIVLLLLLASVVMYECDKAGKLQPSNPEPFYFGFCKEGVSILFDHRASDEETDRRIKRHAESCDTCKEAMDGWVSPPW